MTKEQAERIIQLLEAILRKLECIERDTDSMEYHVRTKR